MFDESKIQALLLMAFGVVVLIVAIGVAATAKRARYDQTARVGFNMVVAMVLVAIGLGSIGFGAFGTEILQALGLAGKKGGN